MGFDDRETDKRSVEVGEGGRSPLSQASSMSDNLPSVAISSLSSRSSSPSGDLVAAGGHLEKTLLTWASRKLAQRMGLGRSLYGTTEDGLGGILRSQSQL